MAGGGLGFPPKKKPWEQLGALCHPGWNEGGLSNPVVGMGDPCRIYQCQVGVRRGWEQQDAGMGPGHSRVEFPSPRELLLVTVSCPELSGGLLGAGISSPCLVQLLPSSHGASLPFLVGFFCLPGGIPGVLGFFFPFYCWKSQN